MAIETVRTSSGRQVAIDVPSGSRLSDSQKRAMGDQASATAEKSLATIKAEGKARSGQSLSQAEYNLLVAGERTTTEDGKTVLKAPEYQRVEKTTVHIDPALGFDSNKALSFFPAGSTNRQVMVESTPTSVQATASYQQTTNNVPSGWATGGEKAFNPSSGNMISDASSYTTKEPYNLYDNMSLKEKTGAIIGQYKQGSFWQGLGQQTFGTGQFQSPSPFGAVGSLFKPIQGYFPSTKGEDIIPATTLGGTGIYNQATGSYNAVIVNPSMTKFENVQMAGIISPTIIQTAEFNAEYNRLTNLKTNVPAIASTTTSVAGIFVAPVLTSAGFLVEGQSMGYEGISQGKPLKSAIGFGTSILGVYGGAKTIANEITQAQIEGVATKTPQIDVGFRIKNDNSVLDYFQSETSTGSAKMFREGVVKSTLQEGSMTKFDVQGAIKNRIATTDFWSDKPILVGSRQSISGTGNLLPISEKTGLSVSKITSTVDYNYAGNIVPNKLAYTRNVLTPDISYSSSVPNKFVYTKNIMPNIKPTSDVYAGLTNVREGLTISIGGRPTSASFDVTSGSVDLMKGSGYKAFSNPQMNFGVDNIAFLKTPTAGNDVKFIQGSSSGTKQVFKSSLLPSQQGAIQSTGFKAPAQSTSVKSAMGFSAGTIPINTQIGKTQTGNINVQRMSPQTTTVTKLISSQGMNLKTIPVSITRTTQGNKSGQISAQGLISEVGLAQSPALKLVQLNTSRFGYNYTGRPIVPLIPFPVNFPKGFELPESRGRRALMKPQSTRYQPSLTAIGSNIKSFSIPKTAYSGLGIRPLISKRRKRKK